jgi:hypothetical protein
MAYSRRNKNKKNSSKKIHYKKTSHKKTSRGGGCGCSRITGGSSHLSDLSPQTYYAYNSSIQNDPNNHQLSTRMAGVDNLRAMSGGRNRKCKSRKNNKSKKQKKIVQKGGLAYSDFNIMNLGVPTNDTPSFLHNLLSTNQPNPNIPMVSPGIRYYV